MKSIRLSLILYFLLLLAGSLGAVSLFVYQTTATALRSRLETNRQLLEQQYDQRRQEEFKKVDTELLHQAYTLANLAYFQSQGNRVFLLQFTQLGVLSAGHSPYGYSLMPMWIAEGSRSAINYEIRPFIATEIQLSEDFLHRDDENAVDFFQINTMRGRLWRSRSLADRRLPFEPEQFAAMQLYEWRFDDIVLDSKMRIRRVQLKVPVTRFLYLFPPKPLPRARTTPVSTSEPPGPMPAPGPIPPRKSESPQMLIQCATDVGQRDLALGQLDSESRDKVQRLEQESAHTLSNLRMKLLWISLATFSAIFVGGFLLVTFGLAPLRRLSDAVSRVSERDFRLQYDGPTPPVELQPIVDRLRQTLEMLQRAFDREKQATADISHELRTPLSALLTTLDVALRRPRNADEYRSTLSECRGIVKQTSELVERLLTLSWLDARSDRLRPQNVDAAAIVEQCATLIGPLAQARGLEFRVHKNGPVPLTTDADKLREVMANLMHNAVEYNRPAGAVDVSLRAGNDGVDFEVRDTGIGIAPENRDRIFERFFRADESRQTTASGIHAGLGLAIVRGYVDLLGGKITVDSELGQGSTFRVWIPSLSGESRDHTRPAS